MCANGVLQNDTELPSALSVLPDVIRDTRRTVIVHGNLDFMLLLDGTILAINNMTWGGVQGLSKGPMDWQDFYVPVHESEHSYDGVLAGSGTFGKWHSERGLTICSTEGSGHMVPQDAPSAAYRQLEYLLGRIQSLSRPTEARRPEEYFHTVSMIQAIIQSLRGLQGTGTCVKYRR